MEFKIKIKVKLDDKKVSKIPNHDENGNILKGYWSKEKVINYFKGNLEFALRDVLDLSDMLYESYTDDLAFENVETLEDLERVFGFKIEIEK